MSNTKYTERDRKSPPSVSIRSLRTATGRTLDDVCKAFEEIAGKPLTKGALSAIESGLRGVSPDTARFLALAYGLDENAIEVAA
jgi:transcriptional regulator with XRE-family HTH domain